MFLFNRYVCTVLLLVVLFAVMGVRSAMAHEGRNVGDYNFIVGFIDEPAIEGMINGVSLRLTSLKEKEPHDHNAHTGGVEQSSDDAIHSNAVGGIDTLEVEVTHIASGISKLMSLKESFGIPGQYEAGFIPTSPGPYRFRFVGDIKGQAVNEIFESGNNTFDEVKSAKEIQFPLQLSAPRETENAARGALETANEAREDAANVASSASTGILLGAIALILGVVALSLAVLAFRRSGRKA